MSDSCKRDENTGETLCNETRKQVGKIMLVLGPIIGVLGWYIVNEGILNEVLK